MTVTSGFLWTNTIHYSSISFLLLAAIGPTIRCRFASIYRLAAELRAVRSVSNINLGLGKGRCFWWQQEVQEWSTIISNGIQENRKRGKHHCKILTYICPSTFFTVIDIGDGNFALRHIDVIVDIVAQHAWFYTQKWKLFRYENIFCTIVGIE